eukprot:TRINITY_DN6359_c0_g1_i1.p1 TRINITY_DN6359_c0_g1~~TRINITY_DN6359_c0_g1_i1.p1  ORF type:complete len:262 (-),score=33.02 TRINITY_DN6359_c0_g1_i1:293-1078(-)
MKSEPTDEERGQLDVLTTTLYFAENRMIMNYWCDWSFEKFNKLLLKIYPVMFTLFVVGLATVLLTFFGVLDGKRRYYCVFSLLMFPVGTLRFISYNLDLIIKLLHIYEVWYLLLNLVAGIIATCVVYEFDLRCLSVVMIFPQILCIIFYDSAIQVPSKKKLPFIVTGCLGLLLIIMLLTFGAVSNTPHILKVFKLSFDATHIVLSCFGNIIFLMLRYIVVYFRYPGITCILRSNYLYENDGSTTRVVPISNLTVVNNLTPV